MNKNIIFPYCNVLTRISVFFLIAVSICSGCVTVTQKPAPINCPAIDASSLQGTIRGTWKGIALNAAEVDGDFEITILPDGKITGKYAGSASGDISGCVDKKGNIEASGTSSSGVVIWIGKITKSNGAFIASGTWQFGSGDGIWSGQE